MSDDTKKQDPTQAKNENQQQELSEKDLANVAGGDLKGECTDTTHKE